MAASEFVPAIEQSMGWEPDDTSILEEIRGKLGSEVEEKLTKVQIKNFIHGYKTEGIQKIMERLEERLKYQEEIEYKTILDEEFLELPMIAQANPVCIFGQDKFGHPVLYTRPCEANFEMCKMFPDLLKTYFVRTLEHLTHIKEGISEDIGYDIWRHTTIIDVKNLGVLDVKSIYDTLSELLQIANSKYPESAQKIYVINANWKFRLIKNLFDYIIEPTTAEKVQVLGSSYIDKITIEIDAEQIPSDFGGESSEPWINGGIILTKTEYPHDQI